MTKDRSTSCHGGTMLLTVGGDGEFDQIGAARGQCAGPQHQGRTVHLRHEAGGRQLHGQALLGDDVWRGRGRPHRVHLHAVHRRAWQWGRQLLHPRNCNKSTIHQVHSQPTYLIIQRSRTKGNNPASAYFRLWFAGDNPCKCEGK